jgi:hypothetical protein
MNRYLKLVCAGALALAACAESPKIDKPREEMSQRERDSTVAISRLPGSQVVGQALDASDAEAARARALDSASAQ